MVEPFVVFVEFETVSLFWLVIGAAAVVVVVVVIFDLFSPMGDVAGSW